MKTTIRRGRGPWVTALLLGTAFTAACGARGSLSVLSEGGGGPGGSPAGSSASAGGTGGLATSTSASSTSVSSASSTSVSSASSTSVSSASSAASSSGETCTPEVCDGLDNDCDGVVDNGDPGGGAACATGLPGVCTAGVTACSAGKLGCVPKTKPSPEVCDGLDNDCNGVVDDGCATGCSDGTREGYLDVAAYPNIAACSGGWTAPGVLSTLSPQCGRQAGNDSANPGGMGCSVADLCAVGFHVCTGSKEVAARSATGCNGAAPKPELFFVTRQSSNGCNACALGTNTDPAACDGTTCQTGCAQTTLTANDLYGCGSVGAVVSTCGILDRASGNECASLPAVWSCPGPFTEASAVVKPGSAGGGALCCAD